MREVIFRGIRKDNNEWIYGDYLRFNNGSLIIPHIKIENINDVSSLEIIPETLGQYTGYSYFLSRWFGYANKEKIRIYEKDIVRLKDNLYVVLYCNETASFRLYELKYMNKEDFNTNSKISNSIKFKANLETQYKKVGNIFDNM